MNDFNALGLLLVDDEINILRALRRLFRRHGYNTFTAQSGHDALEVLQDQHIGVVLSDMKMPGMSGAEFLRKVAQKWPETVRISLTGHADLQDAIDVINEAGIYQYIGKPWKDDELVNIVEDAFLHYTAQLKNRADQESTSRQNVALKSHNQALKKEIAHKSVKLEKASDKLASAYEGEKKLRLAREQAEQLNHAKSRFLATMSHEMRSPLNAVIAMNALLLETSLTQEQYELAKLAHNGGQSLLALINDILDFSKIEAGMLQLNQDWFDLINLVESVSELMASQALNKPVEVVQVFASGTPREVFGDEIRLKQILINLVSNAVKFTQEGGVHINISPEDDGVKICVKDTGIGISPKEQSKIFEDFFQADNSDSRLYGGTGLGLSICKKLVSLMQGEITVVSEKGTGSCFTVTIPLEGKLPLCSTQSSDLSQLVFVKTSSTTIFSGIKEQLSDFNCAVCSMAELPEANDNFDRVSLIIDIENTTIQSLPHINQFENMLRERNISFPVDNIHLAGLIANDSLGDVNALKERGFSTVLRKPLKYASIIDFALYGVCKEKLSEQPTHDKPALIEDDGKTTQKRAKLLAVEDSPANQAVLKALLKKEPFELIIADDGLHALEHAELDTFDLILMDLAMPRLDGIQATTKIRDGDSKNKNTTIIAMTANAFPEDKKRCLDAGMNDYISKPIDVKKFKDTLYRWLNLDGTYETSTDIAAKDLVHPVGDKQENAVIDIKTLEQLAHDTSYSALPNILKIYFEETAKRIPSMETYYAEGDYTSLGDEAHTLKSSSGSFGGKQLQELARNIELSVKNGDTKQIDCAMVELSSLAANTVEQLKQYLNNIGEQ